MIDATEMKADIDRLFEQSLNELNTGLGETTNTSAEDAFDYSAFDFDDDSLNEEDAESLYKVSKDIEDFYQNLKQSATEDGLDFDLSDPQAKEFFIDFLNMEGVATPDQAKAYFDNKENVEKFFGNYGEQSGMEAEAEAEASAEEVYTDGGTHLDLNEDGTVDEEAFDEMLRNFGAEFEGVRRGTRVVMYDEKPIVVREQTMGSSDTVSMNGKPVKFKRVTKNTELTSYDEESLVEDVDHLAEVITDAYLNNFTKAQTICIAEGMLIIDGVHWCPTFSADVLERMPLNVQSFLEDGCVTNYIEWRGLLRHLKPRNLSIDSADLAYGTIARQLSRFGKRVGAVTFFKQLPSLYILEVAGTSIRKDELRNKEAYGKMKEKSDRVHRKVSLLGGLNWNVCKATNNVFEYGVDCVRNYAKNRGDRGFLRFATGLVARTGLTAVAGAVTLGAHLLRGVKDLVKEATRPVSDDEAFT